MDTVTVIVIICITIPTCITITVCGIVYHSYRKKHQVYRRRISLPFTTQQSSEQISEEETSRTEHYPWQRYLRESLPPARRQSQFHFSPIHTVPIRINLHQSSSNPVSPSLHSMSPPSYAELFLTPRTLANRSETSVAHSTLN